MRLRSALTMVRAQRSGSGPDTQTAMRLVKALAAMAALHSVMFYLWSRLPVGVSMASHKARLLRAVVVLTGLLTLLGDVGDANAATMITTPETHDFTVFAESPNLSQASTSVSFHTFNQALGTLTGVGYSINSSFVSDSPLNYTASISTFGNELISPSSSGPNFSVALMMTRTPAYISVMELLPLMLCFSSLITVLTESLFGAAPEILYRASCLPMITLPS